MTRIRHVEISHFRSIHALAWSPHLGINCLIGPGDSGKSTLLDAIDLCLGARRTTTFADTDFPGTDVSRPIVIAITLGALPDDLMSIERYGEFLRGFDPQTNRIEDEPRAGIETVITVQLTVESDLEPSWRLFSQRALAAGVERGLAWRDRQALAPARIGSYASTNLSWSRSSVLVRLSEEKANLGGELANAAREARSRFGNQAGQQLGETLKVVERKARELGVPVGAHVQAQLDAHAVSIGDGAIALHSDAGIPLRLLGTGSSRLLVAGLQRAAAETATIALVDEVEFGLEPQRVIRFLHSLGSKEQPAPLQVFMTTHSPVVVRELSGDQVWTVRAVDGLLHQITGLGNDHDVQRMLRKEPEAFLSRSIVVCEGASEVGFARGLDLFWESLGYPSFYSLGGSYVNVGGGSPDQCFSHGLTLLTLGYRVLVFVDADKPFTQDVVDRFAAAGGAWITWSAGRALEDELFLSLSDQAIRDLIQRAIEYVGDDLVGQHIKTASSGHATLQSVWEEGQAGCFSPATRTLLGRAARTGKNGWFKDVTRYESIAREVVGPSTQLATDDFKARLGNLFGWLNGA